MPKNPFEITDSEPDVRRPDMSPLIHMPERTLDEIRTKKDAFNAHIWALQDLIPNVSKSVETGDNSDAIGSGIEAEMAGQEFMLIANDMNYARDELVRLGDKEEELIKTGVGLKKAS